LITQPRQDLIQLIVKAVWKLLNEIYHDNSNKKKRKTDGNKEYVTFLSAIQKALWRYNHAGSQLEKEPLLVRIAKPRQHAEEATLLSKNNYETIMEFSRATIITTGCILFSCSVSYFIYQISK
jgi:hypothetical protein